MNIVSYSNFKEPNVKIDTNTLINELKQEYQIDNSYIFEKITDNNDTKYLWSKLGYQNIKNPYDSLTVRIDDKSGNIVTINRFNTKLEEKPIKISENLAKDIALKTNENFTNVTSCQLAYIKPNFFWNNKNQAYEDIDLVRLAYNITIDEIYKIYIDAETGENIAGDIIKATNNACAFSYNEFSYAEQSRNLANSALTRLGYKSLNLGINNNFKTNHVIDFVQNDSKAYGLYIDCHGSTTQLSTDSRTILRTSDVKGNWHLVFLDACSTAANANWAKAFKTTNSYSKRAFLGWKTSVGQKDAYNFCKNFWPETTAKKHSNSIREAAVWAADQVPGSGTTPIKFFGDSSYNGKAY